MLLFFLKLSMNASPEAKVEEIIRERQGLLEEILTW
jgi:hypothetical protein